jgi:hypothetical protein
MVAGDSIIDWEVDVVVIVMSSSFLSGQVKE